MKTFNSPLVKVVQFKAKDVITTSPSEIAPDNVRMHGIGSHAKDRGAYVPSAWDEEQLKK